MRKLLLQSLLQPALTERAPASDDAHLGELAQTLGTAARRRTINVQAERLPFLGFHRRK